MLYQISSSASGSACGRGIADTYVDTRCWTVHGPGNTKVSQFTRNRSDKAMFWESGDADLAIVKDTR